MTRFKAIDADSGVNKEISYSILGGNKNGRFSIDSQSGSITVRSRIERDPPNEEKSFDVTVSLINFDLDVISSLSV